MNAVGMLATKKPEPSVMARLWVGIGPLNFQPGEAAKVLLVIFFAAYLVDKRELLASGTRRVGRLLIPDPKHLGPLLLAWAVSILVMVRQKDLGSSLLFFAVFGAMLYAAKIKVLENNKIELESYGVGAIKLMGVRKL